jgi:sulfite reductase alpha subunit-like flavoprotein
MFENVKFTVLGLGDTNYDKFCFMGKAIDKRLGELGGDRLTPLACADEATNLEETVERWRKENLALIVVFLQIGEKSTDKVAIDNAATNVAATETEDSSLETKMASLEIQECKDNTEIIPISTAIDSKDDHNLSEKDAAKEESETFPVFMDHTGYETYSPLGQLVPLLTIAEQMNMLEELQKASSVTTTTATTATTSNKSTCSSSQAVQYIGPVAIPTNNQISTQSGNVISSMSTSKSTASEKVEYNLEHPYCSHIVHAQWLTEATSSQVTLHEPESTWGESKRVILCELECGQSHAPALSYVPGDSIGILTPNPPYAIHLILQRLNESLSLDENGLAATPHQVYNLSDWISLPTSTVNNNSTSTASPSDTSITLRDYLTYHLDLCGMPKKAHVQYLATQCSSDTSVSKLLSFLAGKEAPKRKLWQEFVEAQALGIVDILALFPSIR